MRTHGLSSFESARLKQNSYVLGEAGLVYVDTPKVACTSFKHALASIAGADFSRLPRSLSSATISELAIHDRDAIDIPSLLDIHEDERNRLLTASDVLRICVVRNPYARLASAWLDRILCHSLSPLAPAMQIIEFPRYVRDWTYLQARFSEFVDYLYRHEAAAMTNHHWQRQSELLLPHLVPYNHVIRLEELGPALDRLLRHLAVRGITWPGLPRINETPMRYAGRLYTAATMRKARALFEADFDTYGYDKLSVPRGHDADLPEIAQVAALQKRNSRIFFLSLTARGLQ